MTWQLFVAINLLTSSIVVPLQRLLLRKEGSDPIAASIVYFFGVLLLLGV